MRLGFPLGLIGLVGIPILIIIYIIKNRYTEQTIPSTYIWTMSEKFLKRRVPISIIAGLISLLLQIFIVALVSLAIAHPVITLADSASSYCFVLDASGSMSTVQNGKTRFDLAKEKIIDIIDDSADGSDYTLIYAGSSTNTQPEKMTDKKAMKQIVSDLEVSYVQFDAETALQKAEEFYQKDENTAVSVYLITDTDYDAHDNVTVINVAKTTVNYALTDVQYDIDGGSLVVTGTVIAYGSDELLQIDLYFDGAEEPEQSDLFAANDSGLQFKFTCPDRTGFESIKVQIANDDDLPLDSSVTVFDVTNENISDVLLVSDTPFFIQAALVAAGLKNVKPIKTSEYDGNTSCGLYIFDGFMPQTLPTDGAVWFFNPPPGNLAGTNFSYQNEIASPRGSAEYPTADASTNRVNKLLTGVTRRGFELKKYIKCSLSRGFTELITCDGNPLLFVGTTSSGQKEVVFAFDVRDSAEFNLYGDFSLLVSNLVNDCFAPVIEQTFYYCGETMYINNPGTFSRGRIIRPSGGKPKSLPPNSQGYWEYSLDEVGVYTIELVLKDNTTRTLNVFVAIPEEERYVYTAGESFSINGEAKNRKFDGYFDPTLYIFIVIAVLAVADFGVYCYEQYQLR